MKSIRTTLIVIGFVTIISLSLSSSIIAEGDWPVKEGDILKWQYVDEKSEEFPDGY